MQADLDLATSTLLEGGLILYPTDTIWGIGCDALNTEAIEKVYDLKRRPGSKSLIILLEDVQEVAHYVSSVPPHLSELLAQFTRPTTLIYPHAINLPDNLIAEDGSIAIRITKDPFCSQLIKQLKRPLVSTSANLSGASSANTFATISEEIKKGVDYIVKYRQNDISPKVASSIIKLLPDGKQEIIR